MANSRQIKRRIGAAKNISKITKAMEMVAASKMKKAQDQATAARPYAYALQNSLQMLSKDIEPDIHPLLKDHGQGFEVMVIVSTDKGLCGSLNNQLLKASLFWIEHNPQGKFIPIGKKAIHFCRLLGLPVHAQFSSLPERVSTEDILPVSSLIIEGFLNHSFSKVSIVFMDFINTLSQKIRETQLLPIVPSDGYQDQELNSNVYSGYNFEPSPGSILDELLPYYIENTIYQAFLEARASEHSARMVTMKNASENAGELVGELQLEFNKSRQANITNELLDITTAILTV